MTVARRATAARTALLVAGVVGVALAVRLLPLYWSPLPATLDGFGHARLAATVAETGRLPSDRLPADQLVFAVLLATARRVLGVPPLRVAQPLAAVLGATTPVLAMALVRRVGRALEWPSRRTLLAAGIAGGLLAVDGLYARRTGVPDEELLGFLLVPLLAVAVHRLFRTRRPAWGLAAGVLAVCLPPLHTFTWLLAALTVLGVAAGWLVRRPTARTAGLVAGATAAVWVLGAGYYALAPRVGLTVRYVGRVTGYPALFLAWVFVLVIGVPWVQRAGPWTQRLAVGGPLLGWVGLVLLNGVTPVFPGTVPTPPVVAGLSLLYLAMVGAAVLALPAVRAARGPGLVVVALLLAPLVNASFALTAALTPAFLGTAVRTHTFAHFPVAVFAAVAAGRAVGGAPIPTPSTLAARARRLGGVLAAAGLVVATAGTVPLAVMDLGTGAVPSTTLQSEAEAVGFADRRLPGAWATDYAFAHLNRLTAPESDARTAPTAAWLADGPPPDCPVLAQRSWTRTGAELFPGPPATLSASDYRRWLGSRHVVYRTTGRDPLVLAVPPSDDRPGC